MKRFLVHWATVALSLWVATKIVSDIFVYSLTALLIAALVLGFINASVRPILVILTFPITIVTLGLFYLVVNGLAFSLAALLVPGFTVRGLTPAIFGALVVSLLSWFIGLFTRVNDEKQHKERRL